MVDENNPPVNEADKGSTTPPVSSGAGQGVQSTEAPLQMPEKFKGKSPDDLAKMYVELERKLGEQSSEVEEARKLKGEVDTLLRAVYADPDLYRKVEDGIQKYLSGGVVPEGRDTIVKPGVKSGEEAKGTAGAPEVNDLRLAEENRVLDDFFTKFGYRNLPDKERQQRYTQLSMVLAELVDPGGKKPVKQIIQEIPLHKLPRFLEHAHRLATYNDTMEQVKRSALASNEENEAASIGSFPASSGRTEAGVQLSNREREIAQKMGISEEAYSKRKVEILKEDRRFK